MAILHEPYAFQLLYIFQKGQFPFPEGEDEYGFDGIVIGVKDDVSRRSRKINRFSQFLGYLLRFVGITAADGFGDHHERIVAQRRIAVRPFSVFFIIPFSKGFCRFLWTSLA